MVPKKSDTRAKRLERWKDYLERGEGWRARTEGRPALLRAAKYFRLDPSKDSELLLNILADVAFGRPGRPRGSKKWDSDKLLQLATDRNEVGLPKLSDRKATIEIKKRHPERYRDTSAEMMRQMLPAARFCFYEFMYDEEDPRELDGGDYGDD